MKHFILPLALLAIGSAACQTGTHYGSNGMRLSVDDAALVRVPVSDRDDIAKARTECAEANDRVEIAKREVQNAKAQVSLAEKEVSIAKAECEAAEKRVDLAHDTNNDSRSAALKDAEQNRSAVRAHHRWALSQVAYEEHRVDEKKAKLATEELRAELCESKLELAKAKAVNAVDQSDIAEYDTAAFEACVADKKMQVAMAEVDADAWDKKLKLCRSGLEDQAKAVPASYRDSWRKIDTSEVK